jgi:TRAP-type C4-dicarboxylate transport system permease small subunit
MREAGLGFLDKILEWSVVISFMLMIVVVMIQIIARYALPWSPHWTEEMARFCFIYMVSLGAGLAIKDNAYVNVTTLLDRIKGPARFYADSMILLSIIVLMVCMLIYSIPLLKIVSLQHSAALQVNMSLIYFSMTAMSLFVAIYAGAQLIVNFKIFQQSL